ncbi:MAG: WGR domain-containing protein [Deltaproteobacteria bacterium]|nr:WGR domain-containing protein [Deltaproteobacteria bacterium]
MPRYEFSEGTSHKFWEIELAGTSFTTTYGRIGTPGQSTTKEFKSEENARKEFEKIIAEKTGKGYVLVGSKTGVAASKPVHTPAAKRDIGKTASLNVEGRSFLKGQVSREEILKLTAKFDASKSFFKAGMESWAYDVLLVEGDVVVKGPLALFKEKLAALVVTGSLVVRGQYRDGYDPETGCFVLGDMEAESVITGGWLNVAGNLSVHGGLVGDYNDCSARIKGKTAARFLHTEQHWFEFGDAVKVDYVLGRPRGKWPKKSELSGLAPSRYPDVLVPEVFCLEGQEDEPFVASALSDEEREDLDDLLMLKHGRIIERMREEKAILLDK